MWLGVVHLGKETLDHGHDGGGGGELMVVVIAVVVMTVKIKCQLSIFMLF